LVFSVTFVIFLKEQEILLILTHLAFFKNIRILVLNSCVSK
jgi:hypothetical protein